MVSFKYRPNSFLRTAPSKGASSSPFGVRIPGIEVPHMKATSGKIGELRSDQIHTKDMQVKNATVGGTSSVSIDAETVPRVTSTVSLDGLSFADFQEVEEEMKSAILEQFSSIGANAITFDNVEANAN